MNNKEKIELILTLARKGDFGTPDNMNKKSSGREAFWRVYEGIRKASDYKGTITYPYAKAGEIYRKTNK